LIGLISKITQVAKEKLSVIVEELQGKFTHGKLPAFERAVATGVYQAVKEFR
jgi:hypothetical protein